jgi:hypothetical protein
MWADSLYILHLPLLSVSDILALSRLYYEYPQRHVQSPLCLLVINIRQWTKPFNQMILSIIQDNKNSPHSTFSI